MVGFGPVGQGVASRARELGANVTVVDRDPVRSVQALHHGCRAADFDDAVRRASVIVTATGFDGVIGPEQVDRLADGAILMNVGHSHREIDVDWLDQHPHTQLRRHLERYEVNGRRVHLLNRGSLVNLATSLSTAAPQLFDPFLALEGSRRDDSVLTQPSAERCCRFGPSGHRWQCGPVAGSGAPPVARTSSFCPP